MTNQENKKEIESAELNKVMAAIQEPGYIIIEGRPASGKSTFGLSIAKTMAIDNNQPVVFFSLEMNNKALAPRILSTICSLPLGKIRIGDLTKEEWDCFEKNVQSMIGCHLYIDDSNPLTIAEFQTKAKSLVDKNEVKLIIIDYLQLVFDDSVQYASRQEEVIAISRSLGKLSKELNIPIVALSQLSREGNALEIADSADMVFRIRMKG